MSIFVPSVLPSILDNCFHIHSSCCIGQGSFGTIFRCTELHTGKELAVKVEPNTPDSFLKYEYRIMKQLQVHQGFPSAYSYCHTETHNFLVMTRLGPTVEELWERNGREFSMATLAHISIQAVTLLERLHSLGYLHRDIKPENFMFSRDETSQELFLIDFGLSKRFGRESEGTHIKFRTGKQMIGTPRYASFAAHLGMEQGRKDDLLSLFNVIVFLLSGGRLPWMGITASTDRKKYAKIGSRKLSVPVESLAYLPLPLASFVNCLLATPFEAEPPYGYLRRLLLELGSMDRLAKTSFGSDLFSSEQHFLDTYKFEWTENLCTHTVVLCGPSPNNQLSVIASSERPQQNPFSESCSELFSPVPMDTPPVSSKILPTLDTSLSGLPEGIPSRSPSDMDPSHTFDNSNQNLMNRSLTTPILHISQHLSWSLVPGGPTSTSPLLSPKRSMIPLPSLFSSNASPIPTVSHPSSPVLPEFSNSMQIRASRHRRSLQVTPTALKGPNILRKSLSELKKMKPANFLTEERLPVSDLQEPKRSEVHPCRLTISPSTPIVPHKFHRNSLISPNIRSSSPSRRASEVRGKGVPFSSDSTPLQTSQSSPILKQPPLFVRTELGSFQRAQREGTLGKVKGKGDQRQNHPTIGKTPKSSSFLESNCLPTPPQKRAHRFDSPYCHSSHNFFADVHLPLLTDIDGHPS
ncbi:putative Casein kinase I [Blattamonas nauphoetae]|uniref:non-specific serine/threonine protein kinase n=1 Tax=Blattamonas nauphoetae TaxID=2049346 RepID=A0ABQ9XDW8_9EUKA|nr:putative Casein kinase I [Blattamonas nauphoetae]